MRGSCHCGAVCFETKGWVREASVCHCGPCRRMSGGEWAAASVARGALTFEGEVRWFAASDRARRGFCPTCGAFLLWAGPDSDGFAIALGAVDGPTGLRNLPHIFRPETAPEEQAPLRGTCLCGAVRVSFEAAPGELTACHCVQCRKTSGHVPISFDDPGRIARIEGPRARFVSPGGAVRSFCPTCGTKIAFDGPDGLRSLEAGLFDALAGRPADLHIFTADKGDYYHIPPGVPAWPGAAPD